MKRTLIFFLLSSLLTFCLSQEEGCDLPCPEGYGCAYLNTGNKTCFPNEHPCSYVDCPLGAPICVVGLEWQPGCISQGLANCGLAFCESGTYCTVNSNDQPTCLPLGENNPCQPDSCISPTLCVLDSDGIPYCIIQAMYSPAPPTCAEIECEVGSTCIEDPFGTSCSSDPSSCNLDCLKGSHCELSNRGNPICVPDDPICTKVCPIEAPFCTFDPSFEQKCISEALMGCSAEACSDETVCTLNDSDQRLCRPFTEDDLCWDAECIRSEICIQDLSGLPYCVPIAISDPCAIECPSFSHCELSDKEEPFCVPDYYLCNLTCPEDFPICVFNPNFEQRCISHELARCGLSNCPEDSYCAVNDENRQTCLPSEESPCTSAKCTQSTVCSSQGSELFCVPRAIVDPPPPCTKTCDAGFHCNFFNGVQVCFPDDPSAPQGECPKSCPAIYAPVCGDDDVTYSNQCMLWAASCQFSRQIAVASQGVCPSRCPCPQTCPEEYSPVCGSDNKTYPNPCFLARAACLLQLPISVASSGECKDSDPCDTKPCTSNEVCLRTPTSFECVSCDFCPSSCPEEPPLPPPPICGSDGVTYLGECRLRLAACIERRLISVLHLGECSAGPE